MPAVEVSTVPVKTTAIEPISSVAVQAGSEYVSPTVSVIDVLPPVSITGACVAVEAATDSVTVLVCTVAESLEVAIA